MHYRHAQKQTLPIKIILCNACKLPRRSLSQAQCMHEIHSHRVCPPFIGWRALPRESRSELRDKAVYNPNELHSFWKAHDRPELKKQWWISTGRKTKFDPKPRITSIEQDKWKNEGRKLTSFATSRQLFIAVAFFESCLLSFQRNRQLFPP